MSRLLPNLSKNLDELKADVTHLRFNNLLIILVVGSAIDYIGTGTGTNWDVGALFRGERSSTLARCVSDASSSYDFWVISWCLFKLKSYQILKIMFYYSILSLYIGVKATRPAFMVFAVYTALLFSFGGLSWHHPAFQMLSHATGHLYSQMLVMALAVALTIKGMFAKKMG